MNFAMSYLFITMNSNFLFSFVACVLPVVSLTILL